MHTYWPFSYNLSSYKSNTMSASSDVLPAVLPIERSTASEKTKAWREVAEGVELLRFPNGTPATNYNPPFTDGSTCTMLVHGLIMDYKKVRSDFRGLGKLSNLFVYSTQRNSLAVLSKYRKPDGVGLCSFRAPPLLVPTS